MTDTGDAREQRENSASAILAAARGYTRRGWRVVPVIPGQKGVALTRWQAMRLDEDELPKWFGPIGGGRRGLRHNIGILTGEPSGGLVDVDCDAREAAQAAEELLPATGLISGRAGNPASHYWYRIAGELPATTKWADLTPSPSPPRRGEPETETEAAPALAPDGHAGRLIPPLAGEGGQRPGEVLLGRGMLIELRATGQQTVAPPSIHPSGETLRWERGGITQGEPGVVSAHDLRRVVGQVAAVALLARHWPMMGARDEAAKDLAGLLLRGGWPEDETDRFVRLVARIAGDEEWQKRGKARGTARKLTEGGKVTGGTALASRLGADGERVVAQARSWLGLSGLGNAQVAPNAKGDQRAFKDDQSVEMIALEVDDRLRSVVARDIKKGVVNWLWRGRIPLGAITLLDGDPGLGKSLITIDLAARVSTGRAMPDGTPGVDGGVVLLSAEDDPATTIRPRLEIAAANLDRVEIVIGATTYDAGTGRDVEREFLLPHDLPRLERTIRRIEARLVVIDPLMAYLDSTVNSWRDQDVRAALAPLTALAERTGAAILILRHLNKATGMNALYRGGGSIGIVAAARSGLLVAKHPDNPEHERVLAATKSNLGPPMPALRYQLTAPLAGIEGLDEDGIEYLADVPAVEWLGECQFSATTLLAATDADAGKASATKREQAGLWLRAALESGPRPAAELELEAASEGIRPITLDRASKDIGIVKGKQGFAGDGAWVWRLPAAPLANDETETPILLKTITPPKDDHPQRLIALDADDRLKQNTPPCPVTGAAHEYALMRDAQGRGACVECGYVRYAAMGNDAKGAQP